MTDAPRLRAMGLGEILDAAFRLYRGNFLTFVVIYALSYVPVSLLSMGLTAAAYHAAPSVDLDSWEDLNVEQQASYTEAYQRHARFQTAVSYIGLFLYLLVAHPLATGAVTRAVSACYLNEPISVGKAYRAIGSMLFRYLGSVLLSGIAIFLGFMACFVPGLILMTRYAFVCESVVLEGCFGSKARGRSADLVRGSGWRVFCYLIALGVLNIVVAIAVGGLPGMLIPEAALGPLGSTLMTEAFQNFITLFTAPYFSIVVILLYYDLRVRKEAFDLEILAKSMAPAPPARAEVDKGAPGLL